MNYALFLMPEPISSSRSLSATSNLASISIDIPASSPSTKHQRTHSSDIAVDDPDVTRGLSTAEAQRRQSFWGPNDVTAVSRGPRVMLPKGKEGLALFMRSAVGSLQTLVRGSVVGKYVEQFRNPLILLLLGSAIVSLLLGQVENCVSITLVGVRGGVDDGWLLMRHRQCCWWARWRLCKSGGRSDRWRR